MNRAATPPCILRWLVPALVVALLASAPACGGDGSPPRPDIVLISLDTTRRDRMSCYGHERTTTPHLDALAREATRYTAAYAVSSWTLPTHAPLFTGKFPTSHGAMYDPEGPLHLTQGIEGPFEHVRARGLDDDEATLAEVLHEVGYATGGVVAGPWLLKEFGLGAGFDFWDDEGIAVLNGRRAEDVTRAAIRWLDERGDEPFFLFLNYYDPHFPLEPPLEFRPSFAPPGTDLTQLSYEEEVSLLYDVEVCYMDWHVGVLLDALRERELFDDAWIIVISDHGELLGEGGEFGHGRTLTQEEVHIPLIVKEPGTGRSGSVVDLPIQQIDVMPMILEALRIPAPPGMQGSASVPVRHPIIAEVYPLETASEGGDWRMLVHGDRKYLWNSQGRSLLFDLSVPVERRHDLSEVLPEDRERYDSVLERYLERLPGPGEAGPDQVIDPEIQRILEDHGYLGDSSRGASSDGDDG